MSRACTSSTLPLSFSRVVSRTRGPLAQWCGDPLIRRAAGARPVTARPWSRAARSAPSRAGAGAGRAPVELGLQPGAHLVTDPVGLGVGRPGDTPADHNHPL